MSEIFIVTSHADLGERGFSVANLVACKDATIAYEQRLEFIVKGYPGVSVSRIDYIEESHTARSQEQG